MANVKKRNWAFVLYPESAPEDWRELLQQTGLQCAVSPLHDRDENADGTKKKPHYHVILAYSGPTSYNVVKRLTDSLNQPIPQALEQIRGYYRYLTHKDNPDKFQYAETEITFINGFDIQDFVELSNRELRDYYRVMIEFIKYNGIYEYGDFVDEMMKMEDPVFFDVAKSNTIFFERYISSRRNARKETRESK